MAGSISTLSLVNTYFCYRPNICALKHEYLNTFSQLKGLLFLFDLSEASSSPSLMKQPPPVASRGRLRRRSGAAVLCYMNVAVRSCGTLQDIRLKEVSFGLQHTGMQSLKQHRQLHRDHTCKHNTRPKKHHPAQKSLGSENKTKLRMLMATVATNWVIFPLFSINHSSLTHAQRFI